MDVFHVGLDLLVDFMAMFFIFYLLEGCYYDKGSEFVSNELDHYFIFKNLVYNSILELLIRLSYATLDYIWGEFLNGEGHHSCKDFP